MHKLRHREKISVTIRMIRYLLLDLAADGKELAYYIIQSWLALE